MPKKKKRAKLGDGSFRFKPSGLIEYRFCYKNEYGESKRKAVSGETRQECLDKADEFLEGQAKLAQGIDINASISDILRKKYDADYAKNYLSIGAYARNVETVKILEKGGIGLMPIKAVERKHIETFSGSITHYANSTIEKLYIQLRIESVMGPTQFATQCVANLESEMELSHISKVFSGKSLTKAFCLSLKHSISARSAATPRSV